MVSVNNACADITGGVFVIYSCKEMILLRKQIENESHVGFLNGYNNIWSFMGCVGYGKGLFDVDMKGEMRKQYSYELEHGKWEKTKINHPMMTIS